jgi:hypothetical protein
MNNHDFNRGLLYQIMLVVMLGALAIAGCYGGDDTGGRGSGTPQQTPTEPPSQQPSSVPVSFSADIQPILTQSCTSCHNATTRSGGLVLDAGVAFANIVQVPSGQVPSQNYVESGAPDRSYLFRKLTGAPGISGSRMPRNDPTFFDRNPDQLELVRQWIQEGADPFAVSFAADIQPIYTQRCATVGCHDAATQVLGLNLAAGAAYTHIVRVPSQEDPSQNRIEPNAPDRSYLFRKLTGAPGISGSRMPLSNPTFFDQNPVLLGQMRQWIREGATNN